MNKIPYCVPQIIESVLETAKIVSEEVFIHKKVLNAVIDKLAVIDELGDSEHELMRSCLRTAYKALGAKDPYEKQKEEYNEFVIKQLPFFDEYISNSDDPLLAKLNLAAALNFKSLCTRSCSGKDVSKMITKLTLLGSIDNSELEDFRRRIKNAKSILYITASAGEIVADKILIEELAKNYTVSIAVASHPLLCRATITDAELCEIDKLGEIIDPGADMFGVLLEKASSHFRETFKNSDVVIVKSGVNAETLQECGRDYFILGSDKKRRHCADKAENSNIALSTNIRKFLEYIEG